MVRMVIIAVVSAVVVGLVVGVLALRLLPAAVADVATRQMDARALAGARELDVRHAEINRRLDQVTGLVSSLQQDRAAQHGELLGRLEAVHRASADLAGLTGDLREVLANPKARGSWGERTAEDVLRAAGFVEGVNYRKQRSVAGGTIPDFSFLLPHDRLVHMDVKFPISGYLRYLEADSDLVRQQATKEFLRDVRTRIRELSRRGYVAADTTVDCLLVFIPNESVYSFIHEHDPELVDHALAQKVVLCSPFTLFAVLAVIRQAMDNFMVERTSAEILDCLGGFEEQWAKLSDVVDRVGRGLETTQRAYDELAGTRRRAVQKKLDEIGDLRTREGLTPADPERPRLTEIA